MFYNDKSVLFAQVNHFALEPALQSFPELTHARELLIKLIMAICSVKSRFGMSSTAPLLEVSGGGGGRKKSASTAAAACAGEIWIRSGYLYSSHKVVRANQSLPVCRWVGAARAKSVRSFWHDKFVMCSCYVIKERFLIPRLGHILTCHHKLERYVIGNAALARAVAVSVWAQRGAHRGVKTIKCSVAATRK
jgi:hypothetical protein